jgi:pimeloyl-ACP methyl ester carboxylesterase
MLMPRRALQFVAPVLPKALALLLWLGMGLLPVVLLSGCALPFAPAAVSAEGDEAGDEAADEEAAAEDEAGDEETPVAPKPPKKRVAVHQLTPQKQLSRLPHTTLSWQLEGGLVMKGQLFVPQGATPSRPASVAVLLHSLAGTGLNWAPWALQLLQAHHAVLLLDLPGHGQSNTLLDGSTLSWRLFDAKQWHTLPKALTTLWVDVQHPAVRKQWPATTAPQHLGFVGAGLGANLALIEAAAHPEAYRFVVALAPTLNTKGVAPLLAAAVDAHPPTLFVASSTEPDSYAATQQLFRVMGGTKSLRLYKELGAAEELLDGYAPLQQATLAWLGTALQHGDTGHANMAVEATHPAHPAHSPHPASLGTHGAHATKVAHHG